MLGRIGERRWWYIILHELPMPEVTRDVRMCLGRERERKANTEGEGREGTNCKKLKLHERERERETQQVRGTATIT
jgi:hypothetical protein